MTIKCLTVISGLCLLTLFGAPPGLAQGTSGENEQDLRSEIEALKEGQKAIQKELQEIKNLLTTRQAAAPAPTPAPAPREFALDLDGHHFKGEEKARLTLVEFTDYQ